MNKIEVRHSCIIINNYTLGDCKKLEYFFSIYDQTTHQYYFKGIEYIEEEKKLILPRGIDIHFLENLFQTNAVVNSKHNHYDIVDDIMIKYLPRDDRQKEALRFILGESEYRYTKDKSQLCVNLNTGAGKTYLTIASFAYSGIKTGVITSSIDWLSQWSERIQEYTDIKEDEIYFLSGVGSIAKLLRGIVKLDKYKVFLISHDTIRSYGNKYGWYKVTELFDLLRIGLKVYDEAHLYFDNLCKIDFYTNVYKTIYLTATPARSHEEENDIYKLYFKNVPAIDLFDDDEDPRTQYIALHFNSHPTPQEVSECKNQYGLDRNAYTNYVVHNTNFKNILHILIDMIKKVNGKTLIYIGTNYAIEVVQEWIIENYPEFYNDVGIYTSIIKENKKEQLNKKIILSTTKSCGAAIDIPELRMTVVAAEPFKSEVLARQTLGRTRAKDTYYIDVTDVGFYYIKKFYLHKKDVFAKYATKCTDVKLSDKEIQDKVDKILELRSRLIFPVRFIPKNEGMVRPVRFVPYPNMNKEQCC